LALTKGPAGPRGLDGAWFLSGDHLSGLGSPGVKLDKVAIGIDGDIDLRGFFGIDARIRAGFNAVRIHVSLSGPEHPARYEELAAAVDAHCPVLDLFRNPAPVERKLVTAA
jgi:hypothetical protein